MPMYFSEWCNQLQNRENGPNIFRTHLLNSERISQDEFVANCIGDGFLDEEETFEDWLSYNDGAEFFRVNLQESPCYFVAHAGFEAFFTPDGAKLTYFDAPGNRLMEEQLLDSGLAKVLAPANSAAAIFNGLEVDKGMITRHVQHLAGDHDRYLLHSKGEVVAGVLIKDDVVDTLYVCKSARREGYATALFKVVKELHPDLEYSESLTADGKAFKTAIGDGPSM